jgi:Fe-S-cluster containining protein
MIPGLPQPHTTKVDCGTCRACCSHTIVLPLEGDDPSLDWVPNHEGITVLNKRENGDCVYLGPQGCTIWGRHPKICRVFDCAELVKRIDAGAFGGVKRVQTAVTRAGRRRLAGKRP